MRVVATAGHVDHGKSSLVRALTGTDPDRWEEERRRGLTIDLGFAFFELPSGVPVGFVDVPGHVKFLRNMLAGAGAVGAAVLVVAADEGWAAQTEEHLRILELLGVDDGFTVVTKAGRVDAEILELAQVEVLEHVEGTFLADRPVVACDSLTAEGVDRVVAELDALAARLPPPVDGGRARLWIDRTFTIRGAGTVVTGTLAGGSLTTGEQLVVEPRRREVRVRGLQCGHEEVDRAPSGSRVAVNLSGVDADELGRGDALVAPDTWVVADVVDVELRLLGDVPRRDGAAAAGRPLRLELHLGSGAQEVLVHPLAEGFARIRLSTPLPVQPGDRFVVRDTGRDTTVGGGTVLSADPATRRSRAAEALSLPPAERVMAGRARTDVGRFARLLGRPRGDAETEIDRLVAAGCARRLGELVVSAGEDERLLKALTAAVEERHRDAPWEPGVTVGELASRLDLPADAVEALVGSARGLVLDGSAVRATDHRVDLDGDPVAAEVVVRLRRGRWSPPLPGDLGVDAGLVRALERAGRVVTCGEVVFERAAFDEAVDAVVNVISAEGSITVAATRDLLDSSRRYVLALLAALDDRGVTRRAGDTRVAGRQFPA